MEGIFVIAYNFYYSSSQVQLETLISTFLVDLLGFKTFFGREIDHYSSFLNRIRGVLIYLLKNILFDLTNLSFDLDWFDKYSDSNFLICSLGPHFIFWVISENLFESFYFKLKVSTLLLGVNSVVWFEF